MTDSAGNDKNQQFIQNDVICIAIEWISKWSEEETTLGWVEFKTPSREFHIFQTGKW